MRRAVLAGRSASTPVPKGGAGDQAVLCTPHPYPALAPLDSRRLNFFPLYISLMTPFLPHPTAACTTSLTTPELLLAHGVPLSRTVTRTHPHSSCLSPGA